MCRDPTVLSVMRPGRYEKKAAVPRGRAPVEGLPHAQRATLCCQTRDVWDRSFSTSPGSDHIGVLAPFQLPVASHSISCSVTTESRQPVWEAEAGRSL